VGGRPLRVGVVADDVYPGYGGQAAATEGHVGALVELGHEVRVLAGVPSKSLPNALRDALRGGPGETSGGDARAPRAPRGVLVERVPAWRPRGKQMHFALPVRGGRVQALVGWADVVQVNTLTPMGLRALRLARKGGMPAVLGFHHQEENLTLHLDRLRPLVVPGLRVWFGLLCRLPDALVAPTRFAASYARRYTHAPIHVVSNGIRLPEDGPAERERAERTRRRLLGPNGRFLLSYVGRLDPEKRPGDLLDLMAALRPLCPQARLAVAGSGVLSGSLAEKAMDLGLGGTVEFLGYVSEEEKDALLRASDLFVMPSPTELQNIATLEAMARGCAVVATGAPTSAVPEVVGEAGCGLVYEPGDLAGAAREISRLLEEDGELSLLRERALRAASGHDVLGSGRRLVALYRGLLRSRSSRAGSAFATASPGEETGRAR